MPEEAFSPLAWFLGSLLLGCWWAALGYVVFLRDRIDWRTKDHIDVPDCMYCQSTRTYVTNSARPQIRCQTCGGRGPRVAKIGAGHDARAYAAASWRRWIREPVVPPTSRSSAMSPGDPRLSPGFKPPQPRPEGF